MDDVAWGALTLSLTILGGIASWVAFQRRGVATGLRVLAFALLPLAAYLTHTLRMFTRIVDAVTSWATSLVFSPTVWLGLVVAAASALLFVVSGAMRARELGAAPSTTPTARPRGLPAAKPATRSKKAYGDPELDEIEAMLRKRGIS